MMVVSVVIKQVSQKGMAVINKRLAQAGVRLAWMVNKQGAQIIGGHSMAEFDKNKRVTLLELVVSTLA